MNQNILTILPNQEVVVFNTTKKKCYIGESSNDMGVLIDIPSNKTIKSQEIECLIPTTNQTITLSAYDIEDIESLLHDNKAVICRFGNYESWAGVKIINLINVTKLLRSKYLGDTPDYLHEETLRTFFNKPEIATHNQKTNLQDAVGGKVDSILKQSKLSKRSITVRLYNLLFKAFKVDNFDQLGGGVIDIAVDYVNDVDPKLVENYKLK